MVKKKESNLLRCISFGLMVKCTPERDVTVSIHAFGGANSTILKIYPPKVPDAVLMM